MDRARAGEGGTLIEALTYRLGPHSTSDDPTVYRSEEEVAAWRAKDPIRRFAAFLQGRGLLEDPAAEEAEAKEERAQGGRGGGGRPPRAAVQHVRGCLRGNPVAPRRAARLPALRERVTRWPR